MRGTLKLAGDGLCLFTSDTDPSTIGDFTARGRNRVFTRPRPMSAVAGFAGAARKPTFLHMAATTRLRNNSNRRLGSALPK